VLEGDGEDAPSRTGRGYDGVLGELLFLLPFLADVCGIPVLRDIDAALAMTRTAICGVLAALVAVAPASAQFQTQEPSYGGETARRAFYGGFAVSGEAAYRDADLIGFSEQAPTDLALSARLDYALLPQVDLALVADLTGATQAGRTGLSWVVVKPYWHNEGTDYAVRLAVDPLSEGGLGFRQTDVAFLSSTALSPTVTSDLSLGLRRVRTGYSINAPDESADAEPVIPLAGDGPIGYASQSAFQSDPTRSRLVGQSLRASWGYNVLFDPAGSRLTFGVVAEGGDYSVIETRDLEASADAPDVEVPSDRIRSGVGWIRAGLEFSRPSYQLAPILSIPVVTWADVQGRQERHGPRLEKLRLGLRVTLR
ncbi:hypothetical protein, partial [Rubrivirga sp.]|uniref:hypothetical protein n=1 Tax=Rubrivirga sp. TaxID=1885344 RepID=UPI003C78EB05